VQQRDELGHAGHLDDAGAPQADRAADDDRGDEEDDAERAPPVSAPFARTRMTVATSAIVMPAMP
jgi:hypothetical protein